MPSTYSEQKVAFLDYIIEIEQDEVNTTFIITKPNGSKDEMLGQYSNLDEAKLACFMLFLISRHDVFAKHILNRVLYGKGCKMEYVVFKEILRKEGIDMPEEITHTMEFGILFKGKPTYIEKSSPETDLLLVQSLEMVKEIQPLLSGIIKIGILSEELKHKGDGILG